MQLASSLARPPASGTILVADPVGYGLKALELRGRLNVRVILRLSAPEDAADAAPSWNPPLYAVARRGSVAGSPVAAFRAGDRDLALYTVARPEEPRR